MTCCTHQCNEGRDCPNRRPANDLAEYEESELATARMRAIEHRILNRPQGTPHPISMGNFWRWARPTLPAAAWLTAGIIAAALAVSYITEHHSLLLWQLLQAVS